jgi:outer membrane receptor protein involved in Fe transport
MRQRLKLLVIALVVPLLWMAVAGDASAASTTGTLRGRITDEQGEGLPGVTVIARSEALIHERATQTDAAGRFELRDLPPANDYRVVVQMAGYVTMVVDTTVELDAATDLPVVMKAGEISESISVRAEKPVVDKTSAEVSPTFDPEMTDELPVPRQFQSLISMAPGVANDNDGNPNIGGGTQNSNSYILDGVSATDPVTGTFGENFNFDSIDAVDVKLFAVSAEYGNFQGGVANVVTKSGSNEFTGSVRDEITNGAWTQPFDASTQSLFAPGFEDELPARDVNEMSHSLQATLGGPVVRDNAWFFIAYSRPETRAPAFLGNPTGGPFGNGTYTRLFQGDFSLGKVTWQVANNHRVQGTYQEDPANVPICYGEEFFGGPCYDAYNVDFQAQGGYHWIGLWSATWTPTLQTELKFGHFKNTFNITSLAPNPGFPDFIFPSPGGLGSGTENAPFIDLGPIGGTFDATIFDDTPEDRKRDQAELKANYFFSALGDHSIRAGIDYQEQERVGASILAGNALFLGTMNPAPGSDPFDPANRQYYVWYDFAVPSETGPTTKTTAIYVQDDWSVNPHLTLGLGVRYEDTSNENDLGEVIVGNEGFAPRLSATYDVTGEGKYLVKGTAARYLAAVNLQTLSPFVRAAGGQSTYDLYVNANFDGDTFPAAAPDWQLALQVRPDPTQATFDPNLKPQYMDELSIGYEHLFTPSFGAFVRYVDRDFNDIITQRFTWDYSTGGPRKIVFAFNNPEATRTYQAFILQLEKRLSNNWMVLGNYTHSKAEGNVATEAGFETFGAYPGVPQVTQNRFGLLPYDVKDLVKVFADFRVPMRSARHSLGIGTAIQWQTGNPWGANNTNINAVVGPGVDGVQDNPLGTRATDPTFIAGVDQTDPVTTEFFEPRGSHREPDQWELDMQLNYKFAFSKGVNFEARFTVDNVTDEQEVVGVFTTFDPAPGADNTPVGFPTAYSQIQQPRSFNLNFGITW